jgi:hypothetical protein
MIPQTEPDGTLQKWSKPKPKGWQMKPREPITNGNMSVSVNVSESERNAKPSENADGQRNGSKTATGIGSVTGAVAVTGHARYYQTVI